jgi:hypothetical protein
VPQGKHRAHEPEEPQEPAAPWAPAPGEPEPEWAEEIRAGRRARGERLKELFATFDDEPKPGHPKPPRKR